MRPCRLLRGCIIFLALAAPVAVPSCGGSPGRPSPPGATINILSPTDILPVGAYVDMTLQVVFKDGRTTVVTATWGTDRPDIINVQSLSASRLGESGESPEWGVVDHIRKGRVTGLAAGDAMVTATSEYGDCGRPIHVIPEE
jgi:hypothetical protein